MAPIGTLWGDIAQRQTKVILSVAELNGLEITLPVSQFNFTNKPEEFLTKFRHGKVPAFENLEGWKLFEGAAIARYLSEIGGKVKLLGSNAKEDAVIDQWVHFAEHEIGVPAQNALLLVFGLAGPFQRETLDKHVTSLHRGLAYLEAHLATRPSGYVALDSLSLADLVLAGVILQARRVSLGTAEITRYPKVFAHFTKVTEDERVKHLWGAERMPFVEVAITEPRPFSVA